MTAYELADYLDNNVEAMLFTEQSHLDNAANMLRQQADRIGVLEANHKIQVNINEKALQYIAELEKRLQESALDYISVCSQADEHYARVQELEKQCEALADEYAIQVNEVCKLTYEIEQLKPQTKPLSDFEIRGIMAQDECWIGEDCSMPDLIRFARAIEERHGIK